MTLITLKKIPCLSVTHGTITKLLVALAIAVGAGVIGCGVSYAPLPPGSVVGRPRIYDYSPSVIQSGNLQQFWWCGQGYNPTDNNQYTDAIQYESIDLVTMAHTGPFPVLAERQNAWDSVYTCNPKVVEGVFTNPLGDGRNFSYAMYYVATDTIAGTGNSIGVAFSNDGLSWKKYPQPVISPAVTQGYGVGQPAVDNTDHHAAIRMFYEDDSFGPHHTEAISVDGVHFVTVGTLTTNGLNADSQSWGDMAYDPQTGYWYAGFNTADRNASTTEGHPELGQYGIKLYRIRDASVLTGATPWELLSNVDTNLTGYESNFIPGFLRDIFGDLFPGQNIQMFTSISNPPPAWNASPGEAGLAARVGFWDISSFAWVPNHPLVALNRYFNQTTHEVTTGWVDPHGGFSLQSTLGHLYQSPQQGANVPFYGCKSGSTDYFVSLDSACGGARILGTNGYAYSSPVAGVNLVALYLCSTSQDHFASIDPGCEGQSTRQLLGYILP
jgi:hypothetical protein